MGSHSRPFKIAAANNHTSAGGPVQLPALGSLCACHPGSVQQCRGQLLCCCAVATCRAARDRSSRAAALCCVLAGGLLRQAQVEEFHVITWEAKKEQIFEMPTGGAAIMRQGPNLLKLARKEQCLALLTQLRTKFKTDGFIYRVFPNGEVQYLHPKVSRIAACCWEGGAGLQQPPCRINAINQGSSQPAAQPPLQPLFACTCAASSS